MLDFNQRYSLQDIKLLVERMKDLKVLVVGDVIIDEYIYCTVQGLMSKDMGYSARYKKSERYLGGSLAVAGHLASFSEHVTIMSVIGNEGKIHSRILDELSDKMRVDMTYSSVFETIAASVKNAEE